MSSCFSNDDNSQIKISENHPLILQKIIVGEMIHVTNQETLIEEIFKAATSAFKDINKDADQTKFDKEMAVTKNLVRKIIIPFWQLTPEVIEFQSNYDLEAWSRDNYKKRLSENCLQETKTHKLKVNSIEQYRS